LKGKGGALYSLAGAPQGTVTVRLQLGNGVMLCAVAPAKDPTTSNDTTAKFTGARHAPASATCPPCPETSSLGDRTSEAAPAGPRGAPGLDRVSGRVYRLASWRRFHDALRSRGQRTHDRPLPHHPVGRRADRGVHRSDAAHSDALAPADGRPVHAGSAGAGGEARTTHPP